MGKHKRDKIAKAVRQSPMSRASLGEQIISDKIVTESDPKLGSNAEEQDNDPEYIDEKMTQKILKEVRRQQQNLGDEDEDDEEEEETGISSSRKDRRNQIPAPQYVLDASNLSDDEEFATLPSVDPAVYEPTIDEDDEKALELFMRKDAEPTRKLADIIMEKFTEKKTELESQFSDAGITIHDVHPRVVAMYEGCRDVLKTYRSGKLPKAFKIIPKLANWEQILHITEPGGWSAAAMYQAVRIFTSNLKEKMAQRFFNLVLLPRVRDDILQYKKLNFHLYQALRKALFKPAAFTKGILIPLCESGTCTLREAVIIGSVVAKNSVPILHASAAMLMIAEMDYSGANSIFIKIILDKNYALPYRVVDAVVYHFLKFEKDPRELPVLWHQSFLTFIQRYKNYLSSEQKEALHGLLRSHVHFQITAEIRRELQNSKCRDEITTEPPPTIQPSSKFVSQNEDSDSDDDDDEIME